MSEKKFETESLYNHIHTSYENTKTLYHEKNEFQDVILFENPTLGRILMLDSVTQVTSKDEFIYHEMMTHTPILAHDNPENILIIGGGDGGIAREALRHKRTKNIVMIEIDNAVVEFSKKYLPDISAGAFEHPKLTLKIEDGAKYVAETEQKFDVIIVDSTDPQGPGEVLFTKEFYQNCKRILRSNGILVTQNGVPFMQADELKQSVTYFREIFKIGSCFRATIPTYAFGEMTMGWASDKDYSGITVEELTRRYQAESLVTNYYTPAIHKAAFALPAYIERIIQL